MPRENHHLPTQRMIARVTSIDSISPNYLSVKLGTADTNCTPVRTFFLSVLNCFRLIALAPASHCPIASKICRCELPRSG